MTFLSGNNFGTIVWTDGKQVLPRMWTPPMVVECGSCGECYWRADARKVQQPRSRRFGRREVDPAHAAAPSVQEPSEEAFLRALDKGLATSPSRLRTLRILAWWRGNDAIRTDEDSGDREAASRSDASRANLEALFGLLNDRSQADRLVKAEIRRELGDFEGALRLLERVTLPRYGDVVRQMRTMCESRDACVRPLRRDV